MAPDDVPSRFAVDLSGATLLGIYRVERKIADGGMGSVWLGEDTNLGRPVVVKVPHVRFLGEAGFRARFTREITELVRLEHPSIVRILAQGTHEEVPFFVLQYLGGGSLETRLAGAGAGPHGEDAVVPWLRRIADTLDFVHGRGVVHRDVKPGNILFDGEGHVFLSDFGVAKALEEKVDVTDAGTGVGSPNYMAPEQGFGRPLDGAADQYGLATTVYQAIAGRLPFAGSSALEILLAKQKEPPPHLSELAPDLPPDCAETVMRGLAVDPAERFPACGDFADAFLAGAGIYDRTPTRVPTVDDAASSRRRRRLAGAAAVLIAAVAALVGFAAGWFSPGSRERGSTVENTDALEVVLLSPGAEPRRVLRYRPEPGRTDTMAIAIDSEETKQVGEQAPTETRLPRITLRIRLEVTEVAEGGDVSFRWEAVETTLQPVEGTPPAYRDGMRAVAESIQGRSGFGRQSARGINREITHDAPPPAAPEAGPLFSLLGEIVGQISTPLPEEPVGIGARWEVTNAKYHIEGMRVIQTVTYELESLGENEARLKMYVALIGPNQEFAHRELPADAAARLKSAFGDGSGEIAIDLDRLGERSYGMAVTSHATLTVTEGDAEREVSASRSVRYEAVRE